MSKKCHSGFRVTLRLMPLSVVAWLLAAPVRLVCEDGQNTPPSPYVHTRFTTADGLYSNLIDDMVQSHNGFLWLRENGTDLTRFDGQHFDASTKLGFVTALAVAPNGDLWVGTPEDLKRIAVSDLDQFDNWPFNSYSLGTGTGVLVLHFARNGDLWVGSNHGLYRFEQGKLLPAIRGPDIERIEDESNGHLWITTTAGVIEWDGTRALPHPKFADQLGVKPAGIYHVFDDSHGVTWFCTSNGVARRVGSKMEKLEPWGPAGHAVYRVYEDQKGSIWFDRNEGLSRLTATGLEVVAAGMKTRRMYADRDGNLWVGTNGDGLYRFKDSAARTYTTADGLPSNVAMAVLTAHDGSLWTGFNCGGIAQFDGHGFRVYKEKDGLLNSCVWSLAEDLNHDLWVGTWGGGVFRMHDGKFTQLSKPQGLPGDIVRSVIGARDGSVWLSAGTTVSHIRDGHIRNYTAADGLSKTIHRKVYEDRSGEIWVQSYKGAEERLVGDRFEPFSIAGNAGAALMGEDAAGARYFVTYSHQGPEAIFRMMNGQTVQVAADQGAPEMQETKQGDLWLISPASILRLPPGGLDHPLSQDAPLDFEPFGVPDGLPATGPSAGNPVSALTPDGKLWIATNQGLISLDLPHLPRTDQKPEIHLEQVTIDRTSRRPSAELALPAGIYHLELDFDAIEITSPEKIRLQYRMDGVDSDWLDADPPGHAIYSTLPPGRHAFHMRACNRSGIWDRTGNVYYIMQQPYFYQTSWFLACCIALGLLLVAVLNQVRVRQAVTQANLRAEERINERTRIARDLHDTLLQELHGLMFQFQAVRNLMPRRPDEAMRSLDEAIGDTKKALAESRDAIQGLRSEPIAEGNLAELLKATSKELALAEDDAGKLPKFDLIEEGERRNLSPNLRDEVCRIALEVLRNAYQHAHAHRIEAEIRYGDETLRLRIRDDGGGIDPEVLKEGGRPGHWGLRGIRERAERIGARVDFWSEAGAGTEVQIEVPGSAAYETSREGVWPRLLRKARNRARHQ